MRSHRYPHETELQHRAKKAWAKFGLYKEELTDKGVPLNLRLKLFNSVVSPTTLYGCSCWALTEARERKLQAIQMKMMRCILGRRRKTDKTTGDIETWVSWVQRSTLEAKERMKMNNIPYWTQVVSSRKAKWRARLQDLDPFMWAKQVHSWMPIGFRRVGRPVQRWIKEDEP